MPSTLIIGGHGKVALLAAPMLGDLGFSVTSVIRDCAQSADIEATGATPLVLDITEVTPEEWDTLLAGFDVIVWSAGAGGGAPERTYAVDGDAALAVIDSLERLRDAGKTPRGSSMSPTSAPPTTGSPRATPSSPTRTRRRPSTTDSTAPKVLNT